MGLWANNVSLGLSVAVHPSVGHSRNLVQGFGWRMFLQTRNHEMALRHRNFLRGLEEFERVLSRDQIWSLENDIFQVSLICFLLFIRLVALLIEVVVFIVQFLGVQQVALREEDLANIDL